MNNFRTLIDEHKIIQTEIRKINNNEYISFKNGSYINTIEKKEKDNDQPVRGKRFDKFFDSIWDSFIIDECEFENVTKPVVKDTNGGDSYHI